MSTKVIFRRAEVFVLAEVCLPRRPHAGQPRSDVGKKSRDFMQWRTKCNLSMKTTFRDAENDFSGLIIPAGK